MKTKVFDWFSIFNEDINKYSKTQKVKKKKKKSNRLEKIAYIIGDNKQVYTKSLILRVKKILLEWTWIRLTIIAYVL